jgi:hypothetical protein
MGQMDAIEGVSVLYGREGQLESQVMASNIPETNNRRAVVTGLEHRTIMSLTEMSPIFVTQSRNRAQASCVIV